MALAICRQCSSAARHMPPLPVVEIEQLIAAFAMQDERQFLRQIDGVVPTRPAPTMITRAFASDPAMR